MCPKQLTEEQRTKQKIGMVKYNNRRLCLKKYLDTYYNPRPNHGFRVTFRAEYVCKYGYFHERLTYTIIRTNDTNERFHLVSAEDVSDQYKRTLPER